MRSSRLKKSGFLAGALCLVAVCASAQNDPPFTGFSLPLTFGQKFILTNKMLFAPSENQLQNVGIVYAYTPEDFSKIQNSGLHVRWSFKIINSHANASKDSKRRWDVWRVGHQGDNQINNAIEEIKNDNGFIAISKDDHKKFVDNIDPTDEVASNSAKNFKQFFIFKSGR